MSANNCNRTKHSEIKNNNNKKNILLIQIHCMHLFIYSSKSKAIKKGGK